MCRKLTWLVSLVLILGLGHSASAATNSYPPNGATGVSTDVTLSWNPEYGAMSYDVYFGTSSLPAFIGNQSSSYYSPGGLEPGTTYFWRINEIEADTTIHTGVVWSFTTMSVPLEATNPYPADGATNVSIDVVLSWDPGKGALMHDVYFGTSSSPPWIGKLAETSYDPGTLEPGTTYFWRVNEFTAMGTNQGPVWSFTTMSGPVEATNPYPADGAEDVNLGVVLSWDPGFGATSHDVYFDTSSPPAFVGNYGDDDYSPGGLEPGTTYFWKINEVVPVMEGPPIIYEGPVWEFTTISGPVEATNPSPADGAIDVPMTLSWTAGFCAKLHTLYFGTNYADVDADTGGATQTTTTFTPGPLAPNTTYFWRVDASDGVMTHKGLVWRFTTIHIWPAPLWRPLWRPFWFLDAKIMLHYTPFPVYANTGFWGGWYPYHYYYNYYYSWYGPVFCHPCCWPMHWHYWWWDWPWRFNCQYSGYWYQGCWWWWHPWRGGPHFWGFLDRVSYSYWHHQPCITYWWSWYWLYNGRGRCLEIITLGDDEGGGLVLPLDNTVLDNLVVESHEFNVNGGKFEGVFTSPDGGEGVARVRVFDLLDHYIKLGADEEDITALENSDVYQNLLSNSGPDDEVLVQIAEFEIPDPEILITQPGDSTIIQKGQRGSYELSLRTPSEYDVAITVTPQVNAERINLGSGAGKPITLHFPPGDTGPRMVDVSVLEDDMQERSELAVVTHTVESEDKNYLNYELPSVQIAITDIDPNWTELTIPYDGLDHVFAEDLDALPHKGFIINSSEDNIIPFEVYAIDSNGLEIPYSRYEVLPGMTSMINIEEASLYAFRMPLSIEGPAALTAYISVKKGYVMEGQSYSSAKCGESYMTLGVPGPAKYDVTVSGSNTPVWSEKEEDSDCPLDVHVNLYDCNDVSTKTETTLVSKVVKPGDSWTTGTHTVPSGKLLLVRIYCCDEPPGTCRYSYKIEKK